MRRLRTHAQKLTGSEAQLVEPWKPVHRLVLISFDHGTQVLHWSEWRDIELLVGTLVIYFAYNIHERGHSWRIAAFCMVTAVGGCAPPHVAQPNGGTAACQQECSAVLEALAPLDARLHRACMPALHAKPAAVAARIACTLTKNIRAR